MMECKNLEEVRENIDKLDNQIISLIAERGNYVFQASKFKKDSESVKAPKRVDQVIRKVRNLAKEKGIDENLVESVYRTMITEFIELEMKQFKNRT